jgi:exodeoxyribonuclease VII large subunit
MKKYASTISEILESIELSNNEVVLQGELRTHNAFYHHRIFYAELFDGRTTISIAFDPREVEIPDEDCFIEAEGEVLIYANGASLTLWVAQWDVIGDSQFQDDIAYSYQILKKSRKKRAKRSLPKRIQKVLVIGPKADSAHAIQDFLNALERHPAGTSVEIAVRRVRMRGAEAAFDIAEEINTLKRRKDVDLYCIISGGGDRYELEQVFADPVLVEAVCLSKLPCLVGVGHSKDDFPLNEAASWYADTPSAAGAMLGELIQEKRKGCYIVTATCGVSSPEVRFFYHIRDEYLAKTFFGQIFILGYYRVSPFLARMIDRYSPLKTLSYFLLVRPLYTVLRKIL